MRTVAVIQFHFHNENKDLCLIQPRKKRVPFTHANNGKCYSSTTFPQRRPALSHRSVHWAPSNPALIRSRHLQTLLASGSISEWKPAKTSGWQNVKRVKLPDPLSPPPQSRGFFSLLFYLPLECPGRVSFSNCL